MISAFNNYYSKLDKWQKGSYAFHGVFYFIFIYLIAAYNLLLSENPPSYGIAVIQSVGTFLFGIGGVACFFKSIHVNKKVNLGLMALTLLTIPMLGLILWFFFGPVSKDYLS